MLLKSSGDSKKPGKSEITNLLLLSNIAAFEILSLVVLGVEPIIEVFLFVNVLISVDFFAFEIAICFNALCFDGLKKNLSFNVTKAKNFIDGYTAVRKLTDEELESIKVLSQGAALRFLLTRVFDSLNKVEGAIVKIKDPIEYLMRLEFHKNSKNYEDYFF